MPLKDIDPQLKTIAGWGLAVLVLQTAGMTAIGRSQAEEIKESRAETRTSIAKLQADQIAFVRELQAKDEKIVDQLKETGLLLKETRMLAEAIDVRGPRAWIDPPRQSLGSSRKDSR